MARYFALSGLCICLTKCGTIISGSRQIVSIESEPKKAKLIIDGTDVGYTHFATKLPRRRTRQVELQLEGYEPCRMKITKPVSGWVFGNILIGVWLELP